MKLKERKEKKIQKFSYKLIYGVSLPGGIMQMVEMDGRMQTDERQKCPIRSSRHLTYVQHVRARESCAIR